MKRVKVLPKKCPNPLFEKWLLEWREEARTKGSSVENHFTKAIDSLRKYPLRLESGRDCILLQHFGTKLCAMLDRKLKSHLEEKRAAHYSDTEHVDTCDDVEPDILRKKPRSLNNNSLSTEQVPKKTFVPKKKTNVGQKESGRSEDAAPDCLAVPANELEEKSPKKKTAEPISRRSRVHSISSSGSSSGNDLPIVEVIDEVDIETASKLPVTGDNAVKEKPKVKRKVQCKDIIEDNFGDVEAIDALDAAETLIKDQFQLAPNSFDVLLLVDTHETAGSKTKAKNDATISELNSLKARYEVRHLKVGDFAWIARCRDTKRDLVLPYLVERKRMDDLASSIKDGRFHEQKFRLKKSGIPNIIYMVESHGNNQHIGMPLPTLFQAATNSLVQDGFSLKFTESHQHSIQYLTILTNLIEKIYKESHLISCTKEDLDSASTSKDKIPLMEFKEFNSAASKIKTFKVKEMFVRQLLQLKGLSVEKAVAIAEVYPTPEILAKAFQDAGQGAEKLLASLQVGSMQRQLGPALSKTIFELYTRRTLE